MNIRKMFAALMTAVMLMTSITINTATAQEMNDLSSNINEYNELINDFTGEATDEPSSEFIEETPTESVESTEGQIPVEPTESTEDRSSYKPVNRQDEYVTEGLEKAISLNKPQLIVKYKDNVDSYEVINALQSSIRAAQAGNSQFPNSSNLEPSGGRDSERNLYAINADLIERKSELKNLPVFDSDFSMEVNTTYDEMNMDILEFSSATVEELSVVIEILENDENVEYVQPNYMLENLSYGDEPDFPLQWGLSNSGQSINGQSGTSGIDINIVPVWESDEEFSEVVVAVIDSGIDINNSELSGKFVDGWDFYNNDASVFDPNEESHGTMIAGIIAANIDGTGIAGIAQNVKIMPLKFMEHGSGYTSDAIAAIEFAAARGVSIVNCSWGSAIYNPALMDVMSRHSEILFVCAAGNNGNENKIYPAAFGLDNTISVTATDNNGELWQLANYGDSVDIAAPGVDIYSSEGNGKYGYMSGTSVAAAFVAGAAALLKGKDSNNSATAMANMLMISSKLMDFGDGKYIGHGFLDITNALTGEYSIPEGRVAIRLPDEVLAILSSDKSYSQLDQEEIELLRQWLYVREDTMLVCEEAGYSINDSLHKAVIMQQLDITLPQTLEMIKNQGGEGFATMEAKSYSLLSQQYHALNGEIKGVIVELLIEGYSAHRVALALVVAVALSVPLKNIIKSRDGETFDLSKYSEKDKKAIQDASAVYNVKESVLSRYIDQTGMSGGDLVKMLMSCQYELGLFLDNKNQALGRTEEKVISTSENTKGYPSAAFGYNAGKTEQIGINTGSLNYKEQIVNIPGRNGLDLNLSLSYDSSRANNMDRAYIKEIITEYTTFYDYYLYNQWGTLTWRKSGTSNSFVLSPYSPDSSTYLNLTFDKAQTYGNDWKNEVNMGTQGKFVTNYYPQGGWSDLKFGYINYLKCYIFGEKSRGTYYNGYDYDLKYDYYFDAEYTGYFTSNTVPTYENAVRADKTGQTPMEYMGIGWALNFSRIVMEENSANDKYVKFADGSTYKLEGTTLKNYKLKDVTFYNDPNSTQYSGSKYYLQYADGRKEIFNGSGNIIAIKDNYNNTISFSYSGSNVTITDTMGQETKITLNGSTYTVNLPNSSGTITYSLDSSKRLTKKVDAQKEETTYEYNLSTGKFNYIEKNLTNTNAKSVTYHNLKKINFPTGASTNYTYQVATGNLGKQGYYEYYRIQDRYESMSGQTYNKQTYAYSSKNYTGYPDSNSSKENYTSDDLPSTFEYTTTVTDDLSRKTMHTFNSKHLKKDETFSYSGANKQKKDYTYNSNNLPTKITTTTYGTSSQVINEGYTYDDYGNLLIYAGAKANGDTSNTAYRVEYEYYTGTGQYNLMKSKKYRKDSDTLIQENFALVTGNNRLISSHTITENSVTKAKTEYSSYDNYGNLLQSKQYYDGTNFIQTDITYKNGALIETKKTGSATESFTYDSMGRVLTAKNVNGHTTKYEYDKNGRLTTTTNPDLSYATNLYTVNTTQNRITNKDEKGISTIYDYDGLGNLKFVTRSGVKVSGFGYDYYCRLNEETDALNTKTIYAYDYLDRILSKQIGTLYKETNTYYDASTASESKMVSAIEGETNAPTITKAVYFDKYGRVSKQSRIDGASEYSDSFDYDYLDNKTLETNALGYTTKYEYDFAGRVTKATMPDTTVIYQTVYDWLGRKTKSIDPKLAETTYEYNNLSQLTKESIPFEGSYVTTKAHTYDNAGNVLSTEVSNNKPGAASTKSRTEYVYNNRNWLTKVTAYNNSTPLYTEYEYDLLGNKTKMKAANSTQITTYGYDDFNRLTSLKDALGQQPESYTYDLNGNLKTKTNRNGNITTNTYDILNRLTMVSAVPPSGTASEITYTYAKTGATLTEKNENLTTTNVYDNLGRLIKQTESNGIEKQYSYDKVNNRDTFKLYQNGALKINQSYDYDNMNRMTKVKDAGSLVATYVYDKNGNRDSLEYSNGVKTSYTYNKANLVISLENIKGSDIISRYTYSYYLDGNQETKVEKRIGYNDRTTTYVYDGLGRLTSEAEVDTIGNTTKTYTYDTAGNRKTMEVATSGGSLGNTSATTTYDYDLNNRLLSDSTVKGNQTTFNVYQYDKNGNQLSKLQNVLNSVSPLSGQPMLGIVALGNSTDNAVFELNEFDVFNRIISTANEKGSASYKYKADGLRLSKTVNGAVTTHIWDGSNIVLELNGTGGIIDTYIRGINLIKSTVQGFYVYNAHGDVTARTDASGTVKKTYYYDAFGVEMDKDANDTNPFRYCGEYYDKETDTIYLRARHYNPYTGRFSNEDPIRSGLNWYTYCHGNPISFIDPSGLVDVWIREAVKQVYGTDKNLIWDGKKGIASIGNAKFGLSLGNAYLDKEGKMIVDSAVFAKAIGLNNRFGSHNPNVTVEKAFLFMRSEFMSNVLKGSNPSGYQMAPEVPYLLDYSGKTISMKMTEHNMRVSMIEGDGAYFALWTENTALSLASWLKEIYYKQYSREYLVDKYAMAVELWAHAAAYYGAPAIGGGKLSPTVSQFITSEIWKHADIADIGERGFEREDERTLWDTLGFLMKMRRFGF